MGAFIKNGIKAVKMDDIASLLGISKRTLYEIYDDKEELLFEGVKKYGGQRMEAFMEFARNADNVMDIIVGLYRHKIDEARVIAPQFYVDIRKYPKVVKYIDETHERQHGHIGSFFVRGVAEGYFRSDINYELALQMFDAVDQYVLAHSLIEQYSMREIFSNLLLVPLRGMCTLKGIAILDAAVSSELAE
ncbi:MAG: helix-turn-helix transcriptional regulator [Prevotella sp.]|nr:helix-turn-helix transcriptional regulator [Prevotella sp.]